MWLVRGDTLEIFGFTPGGYTQAEASQFFPNIDVSALYRQVMTAVADGVSPPRAIRSVV